MLLRRKNKKQLTDHQPLTIFDFGTVLLRTLKLLSEFAYILVILFGMLGLGAAFGYLISQVDSVKVPSKESLVSQVSSLSAVSDMTYSNGELISTIDSDLLRTPVPSDAISENIKKAIVATEDENFSEHKGVVPKAVFRATLASLVGLGETSGGSTLTQQLLKQQVLGDDPTFKRKSKEIVYALALERYIDKDSILTNYLNISPFGRNNKGQNIAGVEEAAQGIFGVSARDLTIPQAAYLAGLPQSPIVYSPYTSEGQLKSPEDMAYGLTRAKNVLYNMYRTGVLSKEDYESYLTYDVSQDFKQPEAASSTQHDYLYYTVMAEAQDLMYDYLIKRDGVSEKDLKNDETKLAYQTKAQQELRLGGYRITTTINQNVHLAMQNAAAQYGGLLDDGTGQVQMGNVLMDNTTGGVLGFIGGRDYAINQNNHAFDTKRSPGSSTKPILPYGIAIDQGLMGSASMLSNYPTTFSSGQKIMHGDEEGTTMINLQDALNTSWNIPAFWTYQLLRDRGVDVENYMTKLGYDIADYNIESLPLGGGIEVSVAQQTNTYQMLANGGAYLKKHVIDKITSEEGEVIYQYDAKPAQVFSQATASIVQELLRGPLSSGITTTFKSRLQAINPGLANNVDWIGKTGTTNNYSDVWLMLSTPKVSLGNWAGHDDNSSLQSLTGYNNHANYVANLVNAISQAEPSLFDDTKFTLDNSVIKANVLRSTGLKPGTVQVNGRAITVNGATTTSYWAQGGPSAMTYRFAIGGTDSDYQKAWASLMNGN
ncbi:penicillin-binding protein PBP1B [Streptococcus cuniculipharyngis]|uniref:Penicillin-binding protein n=1 Tax=Streptococcus cuniculipharyngis TaxID=1562651 RepID=A0A5C5SCS0_9STRE|nr:penicillin-binding protein PBP1B [Streptococcus cuniculipharyngis]TWS97377.1 penicillin-binding protein [Streptococcus cuniculipharyngis]